MDWRLACFEMWAEEPIFGRLNDLNLIGRRLVSQRYLHAILPPWLHLTGSFYRLINTCLAPIQVLLLPLLPCEIQPRVLLPCIQHTHPAYNSFDVKPVSPTVSVCDGGGTGDPTTFELFHLCFGFLSPTLYIHPSSALLRTLQDQVLVLTFRRRCFTFS